MRSLGVDLAAQPANTATCLVRWEDGLAHVEPPLVGADDERILAAMAAADWIGIDAPFGWPEPFVNAVHAYQHSSSWPDHASSDVLRLRTTDRVVRETVWAARGVSVLPLSVSSDRIAVCAWRCAALLRMHRLDAGTELDRVGGRGIVEVYPSAALAMWGLPHRGYKSGRASGAARATVQRETIVDGLETNAWLVLSEQVRATLIASDHCLDALVSALAATAAALGDTVEPRPDEARAARLEGWIQIPTRDSLGSLDAAGRTS